MWWLYIVETECKNLYTGITTDVERRFSEHQAVFEGSSKKGAKYFRGKKPNRIVYQEPFDSRSAVSKRESEVKKLSRKEKLKLIGNP